MLTATDLLDRWTTNTPPARRGYRRPRRAGPVHQWHHRTAQGDRNHPRSAERADHRSHDTFPARTRPRRGHHVRPVLPCRRRHRLLGDLYAGNTYVVQPRFDAGEWLRLVQEHRVTSTFLVPTMLQRILDHPDFDSTDLSSLAPSPTEPPPHPSHWCAGPWPRCRMWGSPTCSVKPRPSAPTRLCRRRSPRPQPPGIRWPASAGRQVRVVDPDTGSDVETGEVGELWVNTGAHVGEGWLRTGISPAKTPSGYIYPSGRLKDTINRGGEKFGPIEVEDAHPDPSGGDRCGRRRNRGRGDGPTGGGRGGRPQPADARGAAIALPRVDRLFQASRAAEGRRRHSRTTTPARSTAASSPR